MTDDAPGQSVPLGHWGTFWGGIWGRFAASQAFARSCRRLFSPMVSINLAVESPTDATIYIQIPYTDLASSYAADPGPHALPSLYPPLSCSILHICPHVVTLVAASIRP